MAEEVTASHVVKFNFAFDIDKIIGDDKIAGLKLILGNVEKDELFIRYLDRIGQEIRTYVVTRGYPLTPVNGELIQYQDFIESVKKITEQQQNIQKNQEKEIPDEDKNVSSLKEPEITSDEEEIIYNDMIREEFDKMSSGVKIKKIVLTKELLNSKTLIQKIKRYFKNYDVVVSNEHIDSKFSFIIEEKGTIN
ncbi:hypothetical protein [Liquorilactobacillus hordei]|uniref:Uncharacterized protein n=1 Tax=Liquorilactobacillus hordei DSM 19519 TaxID=1423759 RepID=A0A0R1MJ23_9LACO|nr:hypothetical protein [Liquorilactobacillus hordei]KRL08029.1 hypothetical protein FC92_GL001102 [Liquorilactobacillus hordei DSM 19519]QYH51027.1 hypothetical protein G6O70_00230 [Liquorilactobacillus hordei DSM 19519]